MATYTSNNYDGRYLQLTISETTNAINNTSTLNWTLTSTGGAVKYYTIGATTVSINGTTVYSKGQTSWNTQAFPAATGSTSGSITVSHNADGRKSVSVVFSTRVYYYEPIDYGGTLTLANIDRAAPSISLSTSSITASSVNISVTASATSDIWQYSTNGGSSWATFNSSSGASKSHTISGLTPNTTYNIVARARKQSNQVYGTSSTKSIKTLGGSVLSSVNNISADASTASITLKATVYNSSYTHTVKILSGSSTLVTITGVSLSSGVSKTINLTAAQRTALLNAMSSVKTLAATVQLLTYSGSSQIGTTSSKSITLTTSAANSAPVFSGFTYADTNTTTAGVTGNNQILIQTVSRLTVTAAAATAKNGARISSYSVTVGDKVASSVSTTISVGAVNSTGTVPLIVTVIDSRGYTSSSTVNITVIQYEAIRITSMAMRRINEVETTCEVDLAGRFSPVPVNGVNKNAFQYLWVRYKKTSEASYSSYITVSGVDTTSNSFSYSSDEFLLLSLDADYSYNVQFYAKDKLGSYSETVTIPQGTPLLSLRRKKIGVNNRTPAAALDVTGEIRQNGFGIMGVVLDIVQSGTNMNDLTEAGIYFQREQPGADYAERNYPANTFGMLEVFTVSSNLVMQRYTCRDNPYRVYIRSKVNSSWGAWAEK